MFLCFLFVCVFVWFFVCLFCVLLFLGVCVCLFFVGFFVRLFSVNIFFFFWGGRFFGEGFLVAFFLRRNTPLKICLIVSFASNKTA